MDVVAEGAETDSDAVETLSCRRHRLRGCCNIRYGLTPKGDRLR
jgi:hypothetical protein